mmetsp:Transcript_30749/g.73234  ORF Transcript_30749/g.73234 Transcript_30749/m.73234 type:complete len:176 (-) Transcript_30749:3834-4361(-)
MIPIRDLLLLCLSLLTVASAFTHSKQNRLRCQAQYSSLFDDTGDGGGSLFSSDVASMKSASGPKVQTDSNGKTIEVGSTVRVSTGGKVTKAFHVTKKLHGSFESETKKFTPSDDDNFFVLPDGLQGTVTKVISPEIGDRPQPIVVKFGPNGEVDAGFDLPATFSMHMSTKEILVV